MHAIKTKTKTLLLAGGIILLIVIAVVAYKLLSDQYAPDIIPDAASTPSQSDNTSSAETIPAPDFTVYDNEGNAMSLSDHLGKPVVVNFWATWCGYCKDEMPHFEKIYKEIKDDVVFMMINVTDGERETQEIGEEFIAKEGYEFPVYYDTELDANYTYGIRSLPTTLFIDKDGNIAAAVENAISEKTLLKGIDLIK